MEDYEKYMQEFYAILAQTGTQNIFIVFWRFNGIKNN